MISALYYMIFGYLSGSILFAKIAAKLFHKENIFTDSTDGNPGTANAFVYGGFFCGLLTLAGDLFKGFLPVYLFIRSQPLSTSPLPMAMILAAPVIGHAFPLFYKFQGGKGIAVSFGCLLGLLPFGTPVLILVFYFLFFTLILKITPDFYRTLITYLCSAVTISVLLGVNGITLGFWLMTGILCLRLHLSKEIRKEMRISLLWKH